MRVRSITYSMLRVVGQYENDRVEITAELEGNEPSLEVAMRKLKQLCEESLKLPSKRPPSKDVRGIDERFAGLDMD